MSFAEFARNIALPLSAAQAAFAAVAFDDSSLHELRPELRDLAAELFGDSVDEIPQGARSTICLVAGRGGGKSRLAGAYLVWRALTADLSSLSPGETAYALTIAPDKDLASIALSFARGLLESGPFAGMVESETTDSIVLRRPDGHRVSIEVFTASAGGKSVRGKTIIAAVLDEAGFFGRAGASVSAEDNFAAIVPRLVRGGKVIITCTPWLRSGLLWDLYDQNFGKPGAALVALAPTALFRGDDPDTMAMIAREYERDPDTARRELGAEWLSAGTGNLFDPSALESSIVEHVPKATHGRISIGGDIGLVQDPTAFVVLQRPIGTDEIRVLDVLELKPKRGAPVELENVVRAAAGLCQQYGVRRIHVDHHSLAQAREWASKLGAKIVFEPASESGDRRQLRFQRMADAVKRNRLQIPKAFAPLADQLGSLVASPRAKGGFSFEAPRRAGSHADSAMACILAAESLLADGAHLESLRQLAGNPLRAGVRLMSFGAAFGHEATESSYAAMRGAIEASSGFCPKCGHRSYSRCCV